MKSFFSRLTHFALRFRAVTLALVLLVSVLGVVAISQLKQELIPPIEFPQTIILAQASGMSSEQVLTVLTDRLEAHLDQIPEVVNVESITTGAFGSVITARNDFGINQPQLRQDIQEALNQVWLPQRRIAPDDGQAPQEFASALLADMTPDVLIYLAEKDTNFLFQLSPDVWASFSDGTVQRVLAYLATQVERDEGEKSGLERLVEQEIVPQLQSLNLIANVSVSGGQALPGEESLQLAVADPLAGEESASLLLQLSPEVWAVAAPKAGIADSLNADAVETLRQIAVEVPATAPELPASWQMDHFVDASDLLEMRSATRNLAQSFNAFRESGQIAGALGQTNDLTGETITRMLEIDPTLVEHFEAEHLAAMPPDAFAALPDHFIAGLDGFTRDELAAAALAESITGREAAPAPVNLPSAWRIQPPQLIAFSFADLPLATFSVFSTAEAAPQELASATVETAAESTPEPVLDSNQSNRQEIPEGPALPFLFQLMGNQFGVELNTADDLVNMQLPEETAEQFGASTVSAAQLFNLLIQFSDPESLPPGAPAIPLDLKSLIGAISPEAIAFIAEYDPTFLPNLQSAVYEAFSDEVLALPQVAPPLDRVWDTLARQPQFTQRPLRNAADVLALGDGQASRVLNSLNQSVPERFAGYEVRLLDSLSPAVVRYFVIHEPDFFAHLDDEVLQKLSPTVLALLPEDFLGTLEPELAETLTAIAGGKQPSAATALTALYTTDVPEADPNAPPLAADWELIANFLGIELDSADDFFRFTDAIPDVAAFFNSFYDSPQGQALAPTLFGSLSLEAVNYLVEREPDLLNALRVEVLQELPENVLAALPEDVQQRATSGGEPFVPTRTVTRMNGSPSLLVTVYKTSDANVVEAFDQAQAVIRAIDEENEDISVAVALEQASFVRESIDGVAREGSLGAFFAVVIILLFLSGGIWSRSPRRLVGTGLTLLSLLGLTLMVTSGLAAAGGDVKLAFDQADVVVRVLLLLGVVAGAIIMVWPGELPDPAWRSTLVTAVSIPLSILMAMALMKWFVPWAHELLEPSAASSGLATFALRLFPASITLNIMTLSGLTVAIGRVVDDSIVVLENIFRQIQEGIPKREAILTGTRDVSVAIFTATLVTVVVFLPLGLTGGIIGEFFLPFGLAVTYALLASFVVAVTVVPVLAYLFIEESHVPRSHANWMERIYLPTLNWSLSKGTHRVLVLAFAALSMLIGVVLFGTRPAQFLPNFGEAQINVSVELPASTKIIETNQKVAELERFIETTFPEEDVSAIQTTIGSSGLNLQSFLLGGSSVSENAASLVVTLAEQEKLDAWAQQIRAEAERIFGEENVSVSGASATEQGFGGFALVLSGPQEELAAIDPQVIETLNNVEGLTNVTGTLSQVGAAGSDDDAPATYIRIDRESAVQYSGELETENTLGVQAQAKAAVLAMPGLPESISVSEGFSTRLQTEGFQNMFVAMAIAIAIVVVILMITFRSLVHWLDIILSIIVAPVGAAVALTLTSRALGISAMIGLLMLIGIVVTNAVVLIDRVNANRRERHMPVYDALMEAGGRRLRPILMTALATIIALIPLAVGLSQGAIIASELGTVVIGGLFSSTLLTLIVVPVAYSLIHPLHLRIAGMVNGKKKE